MRILIALCVMAPTLAIGPFGSHPVSAAEVFSCAAVHEPSAGRYRVAWANPPAGAWRMVIERNAFGEWYWSGRADPSATEFLHKEPGAGAIQLFYRVKVLAADRSIITTTDCTVTFPVTFDCGFTFNPADGRNGGGGYATWDPVLGANTDGIDYVISTKTGTSSRFWFSKSTDATSIFLDPTHDLTVPAVIVAARLNNKIISVATCVRNFANGPAVHLYCTAGKEQYRSWSDPAMFFNSGKLSSYVADLYRKNGPGQPWELRHTFIGPEFSFRQDPLPDVDLATYKDIRYRVDLWDVTRTTLIDQAICTWVFDG